MAASDDAIMSEPLRLHAAIANYPHAVALKSGGARSARVSLIFEEVEPITRAFRRMVRTLDFDVCEIALTTLAQAYAWGKPIVGIPVVLMRGFHHGALVCRGDSPIGGPRDLPGKRIGVRAYSQTTGVWVRGILQSDYGIDPAGITWVTAEDAHLAEYQDPPNVERIAPGSDLSAMLMDGTIDAGIALTGLDAAQVRTVIADAKLRAAEWFGRTRIYPANHVVCVKQSLLKQHPWLAAELMDMFTAAKEEAVTAPAEARWRSIVGEDVLPYGLSSNRAAIECGLEFAAQQGLIPRAMAAEELFAAIRT